MIDRNKRRALPPLENVGGPQVINHLKIKLFGQRRAIADLDGQASLRPMQHGLAMKADDIDAFAIDAAHFQKLPHGVEVAFCDHGFGLRQSARPRAAIIKRNGGGDRGAKQDAILVLIREEPGPAKGDRGLSVSLNQGDVDAIHRGAAHQDDCRERGHGVFPRCFCRVS